MILRDRFFIGGAWVAPSGKETIDVHDAGTGAVMGRVPLGDEKDVDRAVAAARGAFEAWSSTPGAERAAYLEKISANLKARADEIARLIAQEVGMPIKLSARIQAGLPIANFANYAKLVKDFQFEERVGNSVVVREPVGVVGAITPWNYPLHQIALKVAPALAAGCTVVLKPSEVAPFNAFVLAEVIEAAGLPKGVFNLVTGTGPQAGEALVKHPGVDMISFTGSTRAGKRISELASQSIKRVALELGGKSASVILDDADLPAAVKSTVNGCYLNSGQTCTALTRMLVPQNRIDDAERIAADGAAALDHVRQGGIDLVLLDLMLPGLPGTEVCRRVRELSTVPIIMLTAKDGELDEAEALDTGADDYLTKPFSYVVLVARIRALLRRGGRERPPVLDVGDLRLDPAAHRAWRGDVEISLTPRQFSLLEYLMRKAGEVVSKAEILEHVWDYDFEGDPNIVEVYIRRLRNKLDRPFGRTAIETIRGAGYRLAADGG